MITHTQAIILRVIDFRESSKILTVLSAEHGKIALIARGAKKPKNKLSGLLDIGAILDVVYYYKSTRNVQTLTEASVYYNSNIFRKDFKRASILYATIELVEQLVHENEVNEEVYAFTLNFIQWVGEVEETTLSIFAYVQVRLAEIIGIGLRITVDGNPDFLYLNISNGNLAGQADEEMSYKLTSAQSKFLAASVNTKSKYIFNIEFENGELKQLIHHLDVYFKYHVDGYRDRLSDSIFEQMF